MTHHDELPARMSALLRQYGSWLDPYDDLTLSDEDGDLVRLLAEDRLLSGTPQHVRAVHLIATNRTGRDMWNSFLAMERSIEDHVLDSMQQSLEGFVETASSAELVAEDSTPCSELTYRAQVIDLVARLQKRAASSAATQAERGLLISRYAAETSFASIGRGKYVADDLAMSLVFPSMDPQAEPIGFLITCPVDTVRAKYAGKRFRVLFVEPELSNSGVLAHRVREVGPFDSSGEIEERVDREPTLDHCIVPVWIDVLEGNAT